jgi:hypothetical protein
MPWGYSAFIPLDSAQGRAPDLWYWIRMNVQAQSGEIGVSLFAADRLYDECIISSEDGRRDVLMRLNHPDATGVMIRTGSRQGQAVLTILDATIECEGKPVLS